jgi:hypothetical protein
MNEQTPYQDFVKRFKVLIGKNPHLIKTTLSNIFTMRLIGNKTLGDLAEIAIVEFINQYMYDFKSKHVGKDMFRSKEHEEDIEIINEISEQRFPLSLKAYGDGPLQLSTDKNSKMYTYLETQGELIEDAKAIQDIMSFEAFKEFGEMNVMPLIYREKEKQCNILVFNYQKAKEAVRKIKLEREGSGRKHPVYRFYDKSNNYVCEVRYGDAKANALQRGFWTHTKNAYSHFDSITNGWLDYEDNRTLVELISLALVSTSDGHAKAKSLLLEDIERLKRQSQLR